MARNPYFGMQTAMTRVDIEWPLDEGMRPSEDAKLSLEKLLKGRTTRVAVTPHSGHSVRCGTGLSTLLA